MARVVALYRHPVKSFTPESREWLTVLPDGRIAGDRVLGFRFADTPEPDDVWSSKRGMVALMHTPGVARLRLSYDDAARRLTIRLGGAVLAEGSLDAAGRRLLCDAVADYLLGLKESGLAELSELRFRSNVVIDGAEAWEEQAWLGGRLRIGNVGFRVHAPVVRCLATQANPDTGERDRHVLMTLTRTFAQEQPTFAVALIAEGAGEIRGWAMRWRCYRRHRGEGAWLFAPRVS